MPAGRSGTIGAAGLVRLRYAAGPPRSAPDSAERVMQPFPAVGEPSLDSRRLIAAADCPEEAVEGVSPDAGGEHGIGVADDPRDAGRLGCRRRAGGGISSPDWIAVAGFSAALPVLCIPPGAETEEAV